MNTGTIRILQLTDMHLYADRGRNLLGMNTENSFQAVLKDIHTKNQQPDLVLLTGDLAQDHSMIAYQRLPYSLSFLKCPIYWIPGNHDNPELMTELFAQTELSASKHILFDSWQIILLDSHKHGAVEGYLASTELDRLQHCLEKNPDLFTLIVVHHHLVPLQCSWLDPLDIDNKADFFKFVRPFPRVKAVLFGHIHQEFDEMHHGLRFIASPSTCIQFKPKSTEFALDPIGPGYRWLELNPDGSIATTVHRVKNFDLTLDLNAEGY